MLVPCVLDTILHPLCRLLGTENPLRFERLEQTGTMADLLEEQYRMDPPILCWSNECFYASCLQHCGLRRAPFACEIWNVVMWYRRSGFSC